MLSVPLSVSSNNYPRPASFQNLIKICFEIQRQSLSHTHTRVATVILCQLFSVGNELAAGDGVSLIEVICAEWFLGVGCFLFFWAPFGNRFYRSVAKTVLS